MNSGRVRPPRRTAPPTPLHLAESVSVRRKPSYREIILLELEEACPACYVQVERGEALREFFSFFGYGKCSICKRYTYKDLTKKINQIKNKI